MNKLKLIQEEINKKINNRPIFYITKDYEKALGLEGLLPYLTMITPHQRFVSKTKLKLQEFEIESQKASTYRILQNSKVEEFIKSKDENALIQVFKINSQIERVSNENNFILLNPKSKLNLLFEQKISQYELLSQAGTNFPTTIITMLKDVNFNELKDNLGSPFVVQFNSSHTGSGTIFIDNEVTLTELQEKFPNRTVRIAKFVQGKTYTLNCVIYDSKTYFGGLSLQLIGLEKFSKNKGATVGNDWGRAKDLSENQIKLVANEAKVIGSRMSKEGYQGMFGIDFIVNDQNVFVIEVNARQPASIPMHTKLQLMSDQIPLSLLHICEFLEIEVDIDNDDYNNNNLFAKDAFQVFLRADEELKLHDNFRFKTGKYSLEKNFEYINDDIGIDNLAENEIHLRINPTTEIIKKGEELCRFQMIGSFEDNREKLEEFVDQILNEVRISSTKP